jgi:hypothetical protein
LKTKITESQELLSSTEQKGKKFFFRYDFTEKTREDENLGTTTYYEFFEVQLDSDDLVVANRAYKQHKLDEILKLESELVRPMRELLSTNTTESDRQFAQSKVDSIESKIQAIRVIVSNLEM